MDESWYYHAHASHTSQEGEGHMHVFGDTTTSMRTCHAFISQVGLVCVYSSGDNWHSKYKHWKWQTPLPSPNYGGDICHSYKLTLRWQLLLTCTDTGGVAVTHIWADVGRSRNCHPHVCTDHTACAYTSINCHSPTVVVWNVLTAALLTRFHPISIVAKLTGYTFLFTLVATDT